MHDEDDVASAEVVLHSYFYNFFFGCITWHVCHSVLGYIKPVLIESFVLNSSELVKEVNYVVEEKVASCSEMVKFKCLFQFACLYES